MYFWDEWKGDKGLNNLQKGVMFVGSRALSLSDLYWYARCLQL